MTKGLEALKYIQENYCDKCDGICNNCSINALEKELKALEILKAFDFVIEDYTKEFNGSVRVSQRRIILDNEEIDLLKEVLL